MERRSGRADFCYSGFRTDESGLNETRGSERFLWIPSESGTRVQATPMHLPFIPLLAVLTGLAVSGCAYYPQPASSLPLGASKAQVQSAIGSPKSKSRDGSVTTWNYGGGTVCVFKDDQLVASNYNGPLGRPSSVSIGSVLPPVSVNFVPAPYYYPAPVYGGPVYYGGGWGRPYVSGGWGYGWGRPWGGWGGCGRPYGGGGGYYRNNCYQGNWNRGNCYNR